MSVREIFDHETLLARHISSEEWGTELKFFSREEEYVQAGIWSYQKGRKLAPHIHQETPRTALFTQEILFIKRGALKADIYNRSEQLVTSLVAREGDILAMLDGGHGYTILENGTQVLEIKNGPYPGPERDRKRF